MKRFLFVTIVLLAAILVFTVERGRTAILTVTTRTDVIDATDGATSLREAIAAAQAQDTITFDTSLSGTTLILRLGQLTIRQALIIEGLGANVLRLDGNGASRVLAIENGANVTITGMTITAGATDLNGGGILNNDSTLTLINCMISGNTGGAGGGIFNVIGTLTLNGSTVSGNQGRGGGGIFNQNGTVSLTNSTISGNVGILAGGGIANNSGQMHLSHSTISNNTAEIADGGGIANDRGTIQLERTIIAGNTAFAVSSADCSTFNGPLQSLGANLVGVGTGCPSDGSGDQTIDPTIVFTTVLEPLQDRGGPTVTHALLSGSPAIDAASTCPPPAVDQRGIPRPQGAACDVGAFEYRIDNLAPLANAGPDQEVPVDSRVFLDGSGSHDPNGDAVQFQWVFTSQPLGSTATLSTPTASSTTFIVDHEGLYEVQLQVRDDVLAGTDTVRITTILPPPNRAPLADAGLDQTIAIGTQVVLDGNGSHDPDGDAVQFQWAFTSQPPGSTAALSTPTVSSTTFVADREGLYEVQLQVRDGVLDGVPDTVRITANPVASTNGRPIADAGPDQHVTVGVVVSLDGSGSHDPDGDAVSYQWALSSLPTGSGATLSTPTASSTTFVTDRQGPYEVQLQVDDGLDQSASDTVRIIAEEPEMVSGEN